MARSTEAATGTKSPIFAGSQNLDHSGRAGKYLEMAAETVASCPFSRLNELLKGRFHATE